MKKLLLASLVVAATLAVASTGAAGSRDGGGTIAFTRYDDNGNSHITVTTPWGGHEREISLPYPGDNPTWSPDGRKLLVNVFTPDGAALPATVNADGSGFRVLAVSGLPDGTALGCHAWSPSGRLLLCQAINFSGQNQADGIYTIRASDGGALTRLTVNPYPPELTPGGDFGGGDIPGGFSPSGRQFVFMRAKPGSDPTHPDQGQTGALYVENTDGSDLRQITPYGVPNSHDNGIPRWSPDGRWIAFAGADFTLQLIHPDGSGQREIPITDPAGRTFAFTPNWSPDGRRLVFSLYLPTPDQEDIYTVRLDGSGLTQITNTPEFEDFADWTGRG